MPQGFVTRVTVGRHVVMHWDKLMPHVVDRVHSFLHETTREKINSMAK